MKSYVNDSKSISDLFWLSYIRQTKFSKIRHQQNNFSDSKRSEDPIRKTVVIIIVTALSLLISQWLYAQEESSPEEHHVEHHEEEAHYKHAISVEIGHSHLSEGVSNGEKQWLIVPSWAINYNYLINHKWAVGLHTDIIIENFEVVVSSNDDGDEIETIERTRPVSFVGAVTYKPLHYLGIVAGAGIEYAPEETFTLIRIGLEPSFEVSPKWEVIFSMVYDIKIDAYNNWAMGVGVARLF